MDFHCTREGHEKLARIVLDAVFTNTKEIAHITNSKFYYDNTGLDGMILDAHKRLELYQNARVTNNYDNTILSSFSDDAKELSCDSLIREHEKECLVYKKAKEFKHK